MGFRFEEKAWKVREALWKDKVKWLWRHQATSPSLSQAPVLQPLHSCLPDRSGNRPRCSLLVRPLPLGLVREDAAFADAKCAACPGRTNS